LRGRENLSSYSSHLCHTLSNACVMSKNAAEQCCLFFMALFICRIILCVFSIVEFFFRLLGETLLRGAFQRFWMQWEGDLLVNRMLTREDVSLVSG
jgi:hypothetical protein